MQSMLWRISAMLIACVAVLGVQPAGASQTIVPTRVVAVLPERRPRPVNWKWHIEPLPGLWNVAARLGRCCIAKIAQVWRTRPFNGIGNNGRKEWSADAMTLCRRA